MNLSDTAFVVGIFVLWLLPVALVWWILNDRSKRLDDSYWHLINAHNSLCERVHEKEITIERLHGEIREKMHESTGMWLELQNKTKDGGK